jgi:hypothetical protein
MEKSAAADGKTEGLILTVDELVEEPNFDSAWDKAQ